MTLNEKAQAILNKGERRAIAVFQNPQDNTTYTKRIRLGRHAGFGALIMQHGRKRFGQPICQLNYLLEIRPIARRNANPAIKWEKQIKKAIFMLEGSGLWPEILAELKIGLEVGYETLLKVKKIDSEWIPENETYEANQNRKFVEVKAIAPKLIRKGERGEYYSTGLIYIWLNPKIKTMYFGKYRNDCRQIDLAIKEKRSYKTCARTGYDVSFEYNAELNKAWYSEEFKDCGNGHYYLALNSTHVVFCEDD